MTTYHNYRNNKGQFVQDPATRSKQAINELYRAFDFFNKWFTGNKLPKTIITIQEAGRRNAYGWFGQSFWKDGVCEQGVHEINLSAEWMSRDVNGILETLLHEMVHLYNADNDVRDCTSGQYHNKHFKSAAAKFGLTAERTGNKGYAYTKLNEAGRAAIEQFNADEDALTGLRRKRVRPVREKRYISLIVDVQLEDQISTGVDMSGLTQKQFVEDAILQAVSRLQPVEVN